MPYFRKVRNISNRFAASECGDNAVLIRRSPHPLDGLEIRTFECQKCGNQTRRIVKA